MTLDAWELITTPTDINTAYGDTRYAIVNGSVVESFNEDGSDIKISFLVDWDQRKQFLDDLLGWAVPGAGGTIQRVLPDQYQDYPKFYALSATVDACGKPRIESGLSLWDKAKVNVTYRPVPYAVLEDNEINTELDRYVIREYDGNADYLTLVGQMKFVADKTILNATPGKVTPNTVIKYTWLKVPALASDPFIPPTFTAINDCVGSLNNTTFDGWAEGTLLFMKPGETRLICPRLATFDSYYWEISYYFQLRDNGVGPYFLEPIGHNYVYNIAANNWDLVTHDGEYEGNRIYQYSDFYDLFKLPT